jgi:hypothetical protein
MIVVVNDPPQTRVSHVRDYFWLAVTAAKYRSCPINRGMQRVRPRFAACLSAWPPAWPSPSGPLGWQRLQGQWRAEGASREAGCEAPLRLEGPARTMRGVPARWL